MKRLTSLCHNVVASKTYSNRFSPTCRQILLQPSTWPTNDGQHYSSGPTVACWNCKKFVAPRSHMICTECGHLQDVDTKINYFDLLNFPMVFSVQSKDLSQRFRQLQALVHPDKFSNKSEREQSNSAEWSALINRAYKTLATPIERGRYMLMVHGLDMPQDNSALNKSFLMEVMEANEQVDETNDLDKLKTLYDDAEKSLEKEAVELSKQFELEAHKEAIKILVKMKYLKSLQDSIKQKIDKLRYKDN